MSASESTPERPNDVQIGWLIIGRLDAVDRDAIFAARQRVRDHLAGLFGDLVFRVPIVERRDVAQGIREEPASLLELGVQERDGRRWDFVIVVTGADLIAHYKASALAAPSNALDVAVMSTARIDPQAVGQEVDEAERRARMTQRAYALALHLLGHIAGLVHLDEHEPGAAMSAIDGLADLDAVEGFSGASMDELGRALRAVADLRVEEERGRARRGLQFTLAAIGANAGEILRAVRHARPTQLPFRLSRLTTAALSALLILINTAEVWEISMNERGPVAIAISLAALAGTTYYVLKRQRLLLPQARGQSTEQIVVSRVAVSLTIFLGMLTAYVMLFALAITLALVVYPTEVIHSWAPTIDGAIGARHYLTLSAFLAAVGIAIGSLGASFEDEHYFRHIAFIDEET